MPLMAAAVGIGNISLLGKAGKWLGNKYDDMTSVDYYDQNKIKKDLAPWQQDIDTMRGQSQTAFDQSQQFFDPRSDYYNQQRQMMREQIAGQQANVVQQQNQLMAQRGMGGGGISGLLGAVSANQAGEQTRQGMLGMQQQGIGLGQRQQQLAGQMQANVAGQQGQLSQNVTQAYLSNIDAKNAARQQELGFWGGLIGGGMTAAGTVAGAYAKSDISLKEDIKLIGKSDKGLNIYKFKYKDKSYGDGTYTGVIAQELKDTKYKDAVLNASDGYLVVDYNKIDVNFERIA